MSTTLYRLGKDSVLYQGNVGATPSTPAGKTVSATVKITKKEADATVRENEGWENIKPTIKSAELNWEMKVKKDDPVRIAMKASFQNETPIALMPLDASIAKNGEGIDADWNVFSYEETQDMENVVIAKFTAKTDLDERLPQWV